MLLGSKINVTERESPLYFCCRIEAGYLLIVISLPILSPCQEPQLIITYNTKRGNSFIQLVLGHDLVSIPYPYNLVSCH